MISPGVRELLDIPGRKLLAANSRRFRSAPLAAELVEAARLLRGTNPAVAQDCAETAILIARHFGGDHLVRAAAEYGNILRIRGFYRRARLALSEALSHRSCSIAARLDTLSYMASLEESIRDFSRADRLLGDGLRLAEQDQDRARFLIQRGIVCQYSGRPAASLKLLRNASNLVPSHEPRLGLSVAQSYAAALSEAGWPRAGRAVLDRCIHLHQFATETDQAKLRWAEGKIALAAQCYQEALVAFQAAQQHFSSSHEAALLDLEIAIVLVHLGRCPEAVEISKKCQASLELLGIGPDAMVAQLLRRAIETPSTAQLQSTARALVLCPPRDAEDS